jgi:hypothetical protein
MTQIKLYKSSRLGKLTIKYGKEVFTFSLFDELAIKEVNLNRQIKDQPSAYGFLLLLQKKLNTEFEIAKSDRRKLQGKLYLKAKENLRAKSTGKGYSDEAAKAYVYKNSKYNMLTRRCIEVKDAADSIYAMVRAFEQRKDLMQTLSSNQRREF